MQPLEILDDGRPGVAGPQPRRAAAVLVAAGLVAGVLAGVAGGQAWAGHQSDLEAAGAVQLTPVLTTARLQRDAGAGPYVKVVGQVVNAGPRQVRLSRSPSQPASVVLTPDLEPARSSMFLLEVPFGCVGPTMTTPPVLTLTVATDDGTSREVSLPLEDDPVWVDLGLVCLARATS